MIPADCSFCGGPNRQNIIFPSGKTYEYCYCYYCLFAAIDDNFVTFANNRFTFCDENCHCINYVTPNDLQLVGLSLDLIAEYKRPDTLCNDVPCFPLKDDVPGFPLKDDVSGLPLKNGYS
jgi:hypothetical protein